eukprot:Skav235890  [mRNA]  locus=scaffold5594:113834:116783:+ [translate_table: standard]
MLSLALFPELVSDVNHPIAGVTPLLPFHVPAAPRQYNAAKSRFSKDSKEMAKALAKPKIIEGGDVSRGIGRSESRPSGILNRRSQGVNKKKPMPDAGTAAAVAWYSPMDAAAAVTWRVRGSFACTWFIMGCFTYLQGLVHLQFTSSTTHPSSAYRPSDEIH